MPKQTPNMQGRPVWTCWRITLRLYNGDREDRFKKSRLFGCMELRLFSGALNQSLTVMRTRPLIVQAALSWLKGSVAEIGTSGTAHVPAAAATVLLLLPRLLLCCTLLCDSLLCHN